jgi:hypothetical protein
MKCDYRNLCCRFVILFLDFVSRYDLHFVCALLNIQKGEGSFHQQIGPELKEETSKVLHLEHSFVWC